MSRDRGQRGGAGVVEALLDAYRSGLFPMAHPELGTIVWLSPEERGVLPLCEDEGLHVSRSLARRMRSGWFELRCDTDFEGVVRACAVDREDGSWIDDRIVRWYAALHARGHAHCVEAWRADPATGESRMVGGVYGVSIGAAFFGESMFSRPRPRTADGSRDPLDGSDASKVCLVALVRHLHACGFTLFDTQFGNEHIDQFGVVEIPRGAYERRLAAAVGEAERWRDFPRGGA